jgi:hypothetical protein
MKRQKTRLKLSRESLRVIATDLERVAGGAPCLLSRSCNDTDPKTACITDCGGASCVA